MHSRGKKASTDRKRGMYNLQFKVILQMKRKKSKTYRIPTREKSTVNKSFWLAEHDEKQFGG